MRSKKNYYKKQVRLMLTKASGSFAESIWHAKKNSPHQWFIRHISQVFQIKPVAQSTDERPEHITFGGLIYTPESKEIDNILKLVIGKLLQNPKALKELKRRIHELVMSAESISTENLQRDLTDIIREVWKGQSVFYTKYKNKPCSNFFLFIMSLINSSIAYLAGIDSTFEPDSEFNFGDNGKEHWVSIPAIMIGIDTARIAQSPCKERQNDLFEMSFNGTPESIVEWADKDEIITNVAIKLFSNYLDAGEIQMVNFIAEGFYCQNGNYWAEAIYLVDRNGFGTPDLDRYTKEQRIKVSKAYEKAKLQTNGSLSATFASSEEQTLVNVREIDKTQIKLSFTKFMLRNRAIAIPYSHLCSKSIATIH